MTPQLNTNELKSQIAELIESSVRAQGCYLEEITIAPVGKSRVITIIVDSDSHLNLDQVTAVTRAISELLDSYDGLDDGPFTLEVTSPGVDRPLNLPRHWRKNHGRLVKATLSDGNVVVGRIGEATEETVVIGEIAYAYSDVKRAIVEVEFKSVKGDVE